MRDAEGVRTSPMSTRPSGYTTATIKHASPPCVDRQGCQIDRSDLLKRAAIEPGAVRGFEEQRRAPLGNILRLEGLLCIHTVSDLAFYVLHVCMPPYTMNPMCCLYTIVAFSSLKIADDDFIDRDLACNIVSQSPPSRANSELRHAGILMFHSGPDGCNHQRLGSKHLIQMHKAVRIHWRCRRN